MIKKNAVLYSRVDREDGWVSNGMLFKVRNTNTYEESYIEIKNKLESPEIVAYVVEECCLLDDLFDNDETYKFVRTEWSRGGVCFEFENSDLNTVEYKFRQDYVYCDTQEDEQFTVTVPELKEAAIEERVLRFIKQELCTEDEKAELFDEVVRGKFAKEYELCYKLIKDNEGEWRMMPNRSCPCTYLDKPCTERCTCKNPFSSTGCYYCTMYGSREQRKARAEQIAAKLSQPDLPASIKTELDLRRMFKRAFMAGYDLAIHGKPAPFFEDEFEKWYNAQFDKEDTKTK